PIPENPSPPPIYASGGGLSADPAEFSSLSPESNGKVFDDGYVASNGPMLSPPAEMGPEEGAALREWRRQNAIRLEEKEKKEKEMLTQIIAEAEEYKVDFYRRRKLSCETNKTTNREKEKERKIMEIEEEKATMSRILQLFLASHEKFHAEADKDYWKSIAELIPKEVPAIEKKRGKKEQEKKPACYGKCRAFGARDLIRKFELLQSANQLVKFSFLDFELQAFLPISLLLVYGETRQIGSEPLSLGANDT
ncbi:unnamed protein product, partial [Thlaspi arvense]